jgi:hypothetical protein
MTFYVRVPAEALLELGRQAANSVLKEFGRKQALNSVLKEFGYTQAFFASYSFAKLGIVIVVSLAVALMIGLGQSTPTSTAPVEALVTAVIGSFALIVGFYQWQQARSEISLDRFYERLAATNDKRVEWWSERRENARLMDDYRVRMYIHLELDNLEYSIQKYQSGWMSSENAYTALRTFCQRCREPGFREAARELVDGNIGYHPLTGRVVNEVWQWARSPDNWYQRHRLAERIATIDPRWDQVQ